MNSYSIVDWVLRSAGSQLTNLQFSHGEQLTEEHRKLLREAVRAVQAASEQIREPKENS